MNDFIKYPHQHKYAETIKGKLSKARYREKLRKIVLEYYGTTCKYCGISDPDVLSIDHINNDGYLRKRKRQFNFYLWLIKNNFPQGYQVLCHNCNWKKEFKRRRDDRGY